MTKQSQTIIASLEEIARLARVSQNPEDLEKVIQSARMAVGTGIKTAALEQLDQELVTWINKLSVITAEPMARKGMVHHVEYWIGKLSRG